MTPGSGDSVVNLSRVLQAIAAVEPAAWYPRDHAAAIPLDRTQIDELLNRARLTGLVRMTDWEAGRGQGYLLTTDGQRAVRNPTRLNSQPARATPVKSARSRFPAEEAPVTRLLVAAQVCVFLFGLLQAAQHNRPVTPYIARGDSPLLVELGVSAPSIQAGAWWTLLTYALVHGGIIHLTLNVIGHLLDVSLAERMWGGLRLSVIYFSSIVIGGVCAVLVTPNGLTVGSSGGWCGVVASAAVLVAARRDRLSAAARQAWFRSFLRVGVLVTTFSLLPGISWGGHLGGAVGGAFAAACLLLTVNRPIWLRAASWTVAMVVPIVAGAGLWIWLARLGPLA